MNTEITEYDLTHTRYATVVDCMTAPWVHTNDNDEFTYMDMDFHDDVMDELHDLKTQHLTIVKDNQPCHQ